MPLPAFKELTLNPPPKPLEGFLGLAPEIRNIIYHHTLVQPIKWARRHKPTCPLCPRTCTVFERPLFTYRDQPCTCIRRTGLNLLLANRQIHKEAAPIFWARNPHCFSICYEFTHVVGLILRPESRVLLRHVSVGSMVWAADANRAYGQDLVCSKINTALFWETVAACKGLERLDLHPFLAWHHGEQHGLIAQLPAQLPLLKSFGCETHNYFSVGEDSKGHWLNAEGKLQTLYCLQRKEVGVEVLTSSSAIRESIRDFETNYLVHVRYAIECDLLGSCGLNVGSLAHRNITYQLAEGLNDRNARHTLRLRDGTDADVHLYGLPLSVETRKRNGRERYLQDVLLRKEGKPTVREQKIKEVSKERRAAQKDKMKAEAETREKSEKETKLKKQDEDRRFLAEQQKLEEDKRKVVLEESLRSAEEAKRIERKRVFRRESRST
ncbi:hypothetical protein GE09DRAFT_1230164 [Coniochaeta sp. 2T2.1]|nr:hypothetical protein GE09DRAFT_1230164 [Coniochaeta sp. 2T2.1]